MKQMVYHDDTEERDRHSGRRDGRSKSREVEKHQVCARMRAAICHHLLNSRGPVREVTPPCRDWSRKEHVTHYWPIKPDGKSSGRF